MATSGDMQLQLILALTDKISGGLDKPIAKLRTLDTKVAETYKAISNLQRLMSQPVSSGGFDKSSKDIQAFGRRSRAAERDYSKLKSSVSQPLPANLLPDSGDGLLPRRRRRGRRDPFGDDPSDKISDLSSLYIQRQQYQALSKVGIGSLEKLYGGVKAAGDFEQSITELRLSLEQIDKTGAVNLPQLNKQMSQFESLGIRLGNTLPGTTQDFVEMFTTLRQGGLSVESILGGAGETVAHLSVLMHQSPKEFGQQFAQFGNEFKLKPQEYGQTSDLFLRAYRGAGVEPSDMMTAMKYFQARAGAPLGMTGVQGAQSATELMAFLRKQGIEGGVAGTAGANLFSRLAARPAPVKKELAALHAKGIDLDFFDKQGKFGGIENAVAQMEKLRKLNPREQVEAVQQLAGARGAMAASAFIQSGVEGYKKIIDELRAVPSAQKQIIEATQIYNNKLENVVGTLENLKVTAFTPMLDTIKPVLDKTNELAGSLQGLAKAHPDFAKNTVEILAFGAGALTVIGVVKTLTTSWRLFQLASTVSRSSALLDLLTGVRSEGRGAGVALGGAASKARNLGKAWGGLRASAGTITFGLVVTGFAYEKLMELIAAKKELDKANTGIGETSKLEYNAFKHLQTKNLAKPNDYNDMAKSALRYLNPNKEFEYALDPSRESGWHKLAFMGQNPYKFNKVFHSDGEMKDYNRDPQGYQERFAAKELNRRAPMLEVPDVMRDFRKMLDNMGLPKQSRESADRVLQLAQPDVFKQVTQGITEQTGLVGKALTDLIDPTNKTAQGFNPLPSSLSNFGSALQAASAQASGFQMPTIPSVFASNYPALKPDQPSSPRPQFSLPGAKPPSTLDKFFHKTSALDADAVRRPKADTVAHLKLAPQGMRTFERHEMIYTPKVDVGSALLPAIASLKEVEAPRPREKTSVDTFQRPHALDADVVRRPAYSMAAFHPDTGKLSRVKTIAFTRPLDTDAVRRPVYTKAAFNQRAGAVVRIDALHVHGGGDAAETARQAGAEVERKVFAALAAQDAKINRETNPRAIHKKWRDEQQIKEERA